MSEELITIKEISNVTRKNSKTKPITDAFLIADIHLGVRMGSDEWRENAEEYFEKFFIPLVEREKTEGSIILCLGDVFDDRKTTNIAVNDLAITVFEKLSKMLPVYIINGNHDMYKKSQNGITSLRSIENVPNITFFKEPTIFTIGQSGSWSKKLFMIPYQDDDGIKDSEILNQNPNTDYVFMHTVIRNLKFDNGMDITLGVETSSIKGKVYAGHIHKRQEKGNVVYVGSPYQLKRSDANNKKGIYRLFFEEGTQKFYENNVSPEFVKITLEEAETWTDNDLEKHLGHNYVDVLIKDERINDVKVGELYDRLSVFKPRKIETKEVRSEFEWNLEDETVEYKDKGIQEITEDMIDSMEIPNEQKTTLKNMNVKILSSIEVVE